MYSVTPVLPDNRSTAIAWPTELCALCFSRNVAMATPRSTASRGPTKLREEIAQQENQFLFQCGGQISPFFRRLQDVSCTESSSTIAHQGSAERAVAEPLADESVRSRRKLLFRDQLRVGKSTCCDGNFSALIPSRVNRRCESISLISQNDDASDFLFYL